MFVNYDYVRKLKEIYLSDTRIELECMGDDPRPVDPGTRGMVRVADDMCTVHCESGNGRRLGLIIGEYLFHIMNEKE